ncbi:LINE-1 type transposase domain-containing protein 1 [Pan troglodytes]|uniref:LINE-1 type transposase domain-containing protein 1 n=1 Tax=Pan troglodytes TaxID=9598 RepID=UPI0023F5860F|nr:LINE-1 type transposase domain-containing protein 1 [Pan troglodytes]XP_016775182.3 LINE-1 type transposase domain-containing protein 1 [Pan troglodytes]XP_054539682.1 LINE-1 type transposase domain-containing protein 1 [Pan troglodytes]
MSDVSTSVQSKFARLAKKKENITYMKREQLTETDKDIAPVLDLKCKDVSAIMNKFKVLMEIQDLMFEEMRETLKNDLKAVLGGKATIPEVKNSENSSSRTEFQQIINLALQKTGMVGKIEGENSKIGDDNENLTFKLKEVNELSGKLDNTNEYNSNDGKKLPQDESRSYEVMGSMEETLCNIDDRDRNRNVHLEFTERESRKDGEDEFVKETREERKFQKFKNKEDVLKASREEKVLMDEGAVLTLAADLSSATLDISKQWSNVFNILREHDFEPKFLCEVKLAFKCDGEIKTFSDLQSLRKFASQKSSMNELLKDVLPQKEEINQGGRKYGIQEKRDKTLIDSKHRAGEITSDGLSFLFLKEVKVAKPEEMNNLETQEEEFSELEELDEEASGMEDDKVTSGLEEEEEEPSGLEEEEEEEASGLEEDEASVLEEEEEQTSEQDSTFQGHTLVDAKHEVEITSDGMETTFIDSVEDSESEEEEEGKSSETGKVKTTSLTEKKASRRQKEIPFSYLVGDSGKKKLVKHQVVHKTQEEEETAVPTSQGTGTPCLTLCLASPSKSLEMSHDEHKKHSHTNLSISTGVTKLKKTEEKKHRTLHTQLTSKEADLTEETEENLSSVINSIREIEEEIGNLKSSHSGVLEIENSVDDLSSRMDILEERIDSLEDQIEEFSKDTMQMTKQIISKERQRDIEERSRSCNIRLIGIPEKESYENRAEDIIKEIIDENFAELKKGSSLEIVSACRVPSKIDEKRLTPRHILVKFWNSSDKEKIIRASRQRREITYQGTRIRLTADLSLDTLDARSKWSNVFKVLLEKGFNPRILYPAKMAFDFRGKTKVFLSIEEFRDYVLHMPALRELLGNNIP